jgi:YegS/Rv2252/BmrU family lipid kinase
VASARVDLLRAEARRRGITLDVRITERAGHARELSAAAAAAGSSLVVVWGGDGTLNEVGSALVGTRTALGLVPAGSGNGLAAALGVPHEPRAALARAFDGVSHAIDAGLIAGRPFFNIAGVGFDAHVAKLFNARTGARRGGWPYLMIGVREGCRYRSVEYDVSLGDDRRRVRAFLIAFANGREYGNGARIAPQARMDDGLLDAVVVEDRSVRARFWDSRYLAGGRAHLAPGVTTRPIARAAIECAGPIEFHVDGEPGTTNGRLEVQVLPGALTVKVEASLGSED